MKTETLRVRNVVDATRFLGAWLRAVEGIGWLAAGTMPNSLYRMPLVYLFLTCVFCYSCSFLFVVFFCVFLFFFCSHWSLVDVPLIFFCSADHVPDWQPRLLLGMVEARSVNVKKTTTTCPRGSPAQDGQADKRHHQGGATRVQGLLNGKGHQDTNSLEDTRSSSLRPR